jgi:hypothetical protein
MALVAPSPVPPSFSKIVKGGMFRAVSFLSLPAALAALVLAQPIVTPAQQAEMPQTSQANSSLSINAGRRLMDEASTAVSAENYAEAASKLGEARDIFNQISTYYQDISGMFSGIDTRISDSSRRQALETAQMRDQATYQLALVHRARNRPDMAVPLLVEILQSQQPTRDLGQRAYQQLYELGFVELPFSGSTSSNP